MLSLWESVRDLTRKDHAGYTSKEEFNRLVANAQSDLFEYYIGICQIDARAKMALQWLIVEATLTKALPQFYNLPSTFRYPLNVGAVVIESDTCTPSIDNYPSDEWSSDEDLLTLRSPIRKPSIAKRRFAHEFLTDKIKMWPKDFGGRIYLKYYKEPPTAALGFTLNTSTQEEEHNAGTTVDLAWPASEKENFIELLLIYKGVILKKGDLVNWVQSKKSLNSLPEAVRPSNTRQI